MGLSGTEGGEGSAAASAGAGVAAPGMVSGRAVAGGLVAVDDGKQFWGGGMSVVDWLPLEQAAVKRTNMMLTMMRRIFTSIVQPMRHIVYNIYKCYHK